MSCAYLFFSGRRSDTSRKAKAKPVRMRDFKKGKLEGGPSWKRSKTKYMRLGLYLHLLVERELGKRTGKCDPGDESKPVENVEKAGLSEGESA
jgi:hypothetical protein